MELLAEREQELEELSRLLDRREGALVIEGGPGIGKTTLLDEARAQAEVLGYEVLGARGSELELGFAFGVVRQLFERVVAAVSEDERGALFGGPAEIASSLLGARLGGLAAYDSSFAVLHGLYWLAVNLAARRPLLLLVDDAHWGDDASLRWLAYLAPRIAGLEVMLLGAVRSLDPLSSRPALVEIHREAVVVRPKALSVVAVGAIVRDAFGGTASEELCVAVHEACGGNPLYLHELLRTIRDDLALDVAGPAGLLEMGQGEVARRVVARVVGLDRAGLSLAQGLAVLGEGAELRHAAAIASLTPERAEVLVEGLVRLEVLHDDPVRFVHPVVRAAFEASMDRHDRDRAHREAAEMLYREGVPAGRVAAHLVGLRSQGDAWVVARLREAARRAMDSGTPGSAARLLRRALAEPPPNEQRVEVLREAAHAAAGAGQKSACEFLEEALGLAVDARERAEIAAEVAETYAALFRWVDAVDVLERALSELRDADPALTARLEGELVVSGLHDARGGPRARAVLERLAARETAHRSEALIVAQGMVSLLRGRPAVETAPPLEAVLERSDGPVENWDTRAALLWVLVANERFDAVELALVSLQDQVRRSGSARGLIAVYSTLGLVKQRLGSLPEAAAAAQVALEVLQQGDFAPGLGFAATVLAEIAIEAGQLEEAQALLELLPAQGWPPGVGTVLIPAARGRLRLAQRRPAEALAEFESCMILFGSPAWGMETREIGYTHARSGAATALLRLGRTEKARELAGAELADAQTFGAPRALGIALRTAGLARGGEDGLALLSESASTLRGSPALLERAHSLAELGAAMRRGGERAAARVPLGQALELATRCGASPLAARAREELVATGARPRRAWRTGVEALTPSELRVARLAAQGRTNREIAQELYVTLKTVEGHLARAYGKLAIAGRSELAGVLESKDQGAHPLANPRLTEQAVVVNPQARGAQ